MTQDQAPERLYVVIDRSAELYCAPWPEACHEHINDMILHAPEEYGSAVVREYIRADLHAAVVAERDEAKSERAAAIRATLAVAKERNEAVRLMREYFTARLSVDRAVIRAEDAKWQAALNRENRAEHDCRAFLVQHDKQADTNKSIGESNAS